MRRRKKKRCLLCFLFLSTSLHLAMSAEILIELRFILFQPLDSDVFQWSPHHGRLSFVAKNFEFIKCTYTLFFQGSKEKLVVLFPQRLLLACWLGEKKKEIYRKMRPRFNAVSACCGCCCICRYGSFGREKEKETQRANLFSWHLRGLRSRICTMAAFHFQGERIHWEMIDFRRIFFSRLACT